jgi:hypothetical protein
MKHGSYNEKGHMKSHFDTIMHFHLRKFRNVE